MKALTHHVFGSGDLDDDARGYAKQVLPANVRVAPNSPKLRANDNTAPDASPGRTSGRVTRRRTVVSRVKPPRSTMAIASFTMRSCSPVSPSDEISSDSNHGEFPRLVAIMRFLPSGDLKKLRPLYKALSYED